MAQQTSTSKPRKVTIDSEEYEVRTVTVWNNKGQSGTIDDSKPITSKVQYKPKPSLADPFPQFSDLADRTEDKNSNNGWSFRPIAGQGFKKSLVEGGPNSLSSQLDRDIQTQVAKDANVPLARSQQALSKITTSKSNQALASENQDPNAPAGGQNQGQAEQQAGSTDAGEDGKQEINIDDIKIEADQRTNYDNLLKYPETLNPQYQDYLKIMMVEYTPRRLSAAQGSLPSRNNLVGSRSDDKVGGRKILSNIILPIPAGIGDSNTLNWSSDEMDMLQLMGADILGSGVAGGPGEAAEAAGRASGAIQNNVGAMQQAATSAIVQNVTGVNRLKRQQGAVFNNNMELLFNGPQLRSFNFTFRLSARSKSEARIIQKIIRTLKQGMSAKKANNFLFVKSPHTFFLGYYRNQELHPFLNKFKECALTGLNMSYTPDGNYATFYDGAITSYEMTMTFQELEPVFDSDYGSDYETIGY